MFVCVYVSMFVRNKLPNHAHYGDEAVAGDSVGLGSGQQLNLIQKNYSRVLLGQNRPLMKKLLFTSREGALQVLKPRLLMNE